MWLWIAVLGCSEYNLTPPDRPVDVPTDTTPAEPPAVPTVDVAVAAPSAATCDAVEVGAEGPIASSACWPPVAPVAAPWDTRVEWTWEAMGDGAIASVWVTPVVADMTGDGVPEIAVTACEWLDSAMGTCLPAVELGGGGHIVNYEGSLVILDGRTGDVLLEQRGYDVFAMLTAADLDGDGLAEVLATTADGYLEAVQVDGSAIFRTASQVHYAESGLFACTGVADLDADGVPEVLSKNATWGPDGQFDLVVFSDVDYEMRSCVTADVDQDGDLEWLMGREALGADGFVEVTLDVPSVIYAESSWTIPVQADNDPFAELAYLGSDAFTVLDDDGSRLVSVPAINTDRSGPPCAGDFDGDGIMEVAAPQGSDLALYELDGTVVWTAPINDPTGVSGCAGFDFDADGALEVIYADHDELYIFDGATGAVQLLDHDRASGTVTDTPVVADVDADGAAELVITNNDNMQMSGWRGVAVLGQVDDAWPPAGPVWSGNDFYVTNLDPDGGVPVAPAPSWLEPKVYRARPAADPAPDLEIAVVDACTASCDPGGEVWLSVQVLNPSTRDADAAVVQLLRRDGGVDTLLQELPIGTARAGEALPGVVFELTADDLGDALVVRVDGAAAECAPDDNEVVWPSPCAP